MEHDIKGQYAHVTVADEQAIILDMNIAKLVSNDRLSVAMMAGLWPANGAVAGAGHVFSFHEGREAVLQALGGPKTVVVVHEAPAKQQR